MPVKRHTGAILLLMAVLALIAGCNSKVGALVKTVPGGDVEAGRASLVAYGCIACHTIPGIPNANTLVGPPLNGYEQRHYIAGNLPNTTPNLIFWLQFPQIVEPGTAMPDLNVSEQDARDMAAYLYSH